MVDERANRKRTGENGTGMNYPSKECLACVLSLYSDNNDTRDRNKSVGSSADGKIAV
jgi:hypothetical protein